MNFPSRQHNLRDHLVTTRFDGLLISHLPNIRYLCGFTGSAGMLFLNATESVLFTDVRYHTQAHEQVVGAKVVISGKGILNAVGDWLEALPKRARGRALGIESEHVTIADSKRLAKCLPTGLGMRAASGIVEKQRMVKDDGELEQIRAAVRLGASLFERVLEVLRPGVKEIEVAAEMEHVARRAGAEEMSISEVSASGAGSALPHGRASSQVIERGGFVVCDFGVILSGYCSDQTRTVWVGELVDEARVAYQAVRQAQSAAIRAVRPGTRVGEVDAAARKVLEEAGVGQNFTHSTGHGVGLEIHEAPRVATGQKELLKPGMVITIEPGVYFPGKWGIRIEDMVAVTATGCEVLPPTSRELFTV